MALQHDFESETAIHLEAIDRVRNIARRYSITMEHDLFGVTIVAYSWGRIGTAGRSRRLSFSSGADARHFAQRLLARRSSAPRRIGIAYKRI